MAWRRPGDKPLSLTMMVRLSGIYASLGLNELRMSFEGGNRYSNSRLHGWQINHGTSYSHEICKYFRYALFCCCYISKGTSYLHGLTLIPAWISDNIHIKVITSILLEMDKSFHPTLYYACMSSLIHVI